MTSMLWPHSVRMSRIKRVFSINALLIISAALCVLLMLKSGEAMATVKAEDFFSGDYLQFAKAIDQENTAAMRELASRIDLNKRVGERKMTVFVYAVATKRLDAMKELISLGADPALVVSGVGAPLSLAASADDPRLIETLLSAGCSPNTTIDDSPLLFYAQLQDRKEIVDVLLKYGAEINARDSIGNTVLSEAIYSMHYDMALHLIEKKSDVFSKTDNGVSTSYVAQKALSRMQENSPGYKKVEKIIEMMKARGVKFPAEPPPQKQ